jgi:hypothetical protein
MADDISVLTKNSAPNVGLDGVATNVRDRGNMFEPEEILDEKQQMRKLMAENKSAMKEALKTMSPIDLFILFDEDDSGLMSFQEFKVMLPMLSIELCDAKAFRYFKMADTVNHYCIIHGLFL